MVLQLQHYITENDMEIIVKQNRETVKQKMSDILLDVSFNLNSDSCPGLKSQSVILRSPGHGFIIKWME